MEAELEGLVTIQSSRCQVDLLNWPASECATLSGPIFIVINGFAHFIVSDFIRLRLREWDIFDETYLHNKSNPLSTGESFP